MGKRPRRTSRRDILNPDWRPRSMRSVPPRTQKFELQSMRWWLRATGTTTALASRHTRELLASFHAYLAACCLTTSWTSNSCWKEEAMLCNARGRFAKKQPSPGYDGKMMKQFDEQFRPEPEPRTTSSSNLAQRPQLQGLEWTRNFDRPEGRHHVGEHAIDEGLKSADQKSHFGGEPRSETCSTPLCGYA